MQAMIVTAVVIGSILLGYIVTGGVLGIYKVIRRRQCHAQDRLEIPLVDQVWGFSSSGVVEIIDAYDDGDIFCRWTEEGRHVGGRLSRAAWQSWVNTEHAFILERS